MIEVDQIAMLDLCTGTFMAVDQERPVAVDDKPGLFITNVELIFIECHAGWQGLTGQLIHMPGKQREMFERNHVRHDEKWLRSISDLKMRSPQFDDRLIFKGDGSYRDSIYDGFVGRIIVMDDEFAVLHFNGAVDG